MGANAEMMLRSFGRTCRATVRATRPERERELIGVAGDRGRPRNYVYGSAKAGLHAYLQGLRARLHRRGVPVTTVKLGFVDTAMTFGRRGVFLVMSPEDAAAAVIRHAERGSDVCCVPAFWRLIMLAIRLVPERVFKRLDL